MSDLHILHDFIRAQKKIQLHEKKLHDRKKTENKIKECIIVVSYICFFDSIHPFCLLGLIIFFRANFFVLLVKNNVFPNRIFK